MLAMTVSYLSRTLTRPSLLVQSLFKIASSSVHCSAIFCSFSLIVTHDLKRKKSVNKNYKNVFFWDSGVQKKCRNFVNFRASLVEFRFKKVISAVYD